MAKLPVLNLFFQIVARGQALVQFLQRELCFTAAAFLRRAADNLGQGKVARNPGKEGTEPIRALVRHCVPGTHPGVIDTFLGILAVFQNVIRDDMAIAPVFLLGFRDGLLRALPI